MSIFADVIKEEIERLEKLLNFYKRKLKTLPRGSIFTMKVRNSSFVYLKWKENGRVISKYIGKEHTTSANDVMIKVQEYKKTKSNIKQAKIELNKLKRAYRVYE